MASHLDKVRDDDSYADILANWDAGFYAKFTDTPFEFQKRDAEAVDHAVCGVVVGEEEIPTATHAEAGSPRRA